jgi:ERCC4-type nuclease
VFTRLKRGREAIFWQTSRTTRQARPGIRVPTRRAAGWPVLHVVIDTRERYPYRFARQQVVTERRALASGDYAVEADGTVLAAVERKSLADLASDLVDGSLAFQMAELASLWRAAVVVEDRYAALFNIERVRRGFLPEVVARLQVRYPSVPIVFCDTRPLAEQWTYRFLGAALAEHAASPDGSMEDDGESAGWPRP